ncbi:Hydrogen peroxide-inducible genes activator [Methylocella tundrae]|uniref:Hydrogen peroxide-inducible genes activator n=1 Tax=Methylocella tundrae TaxID=227605 RepID=A0A8B6M383_METTU|nr:LysR substrate-binding domain-containing protein [Methylocella tundrae]VTZ27132.1 Hydrogen peroxide-inducible genes activator [Methylocella tundrae]VTZ49497.1 Hydrogen peroxide-inducible genes activator [Methylocella tundrae]
MNLRDLRYIIKVADLRHFGRAAMACHVSQPTLSGQILKLEEELGVAIFERVGKSLTTTAAGNLILSHARRAVAAADDIIACAKASRDPMLGPLRLGVIPTLAPYLMPFVLPNARAQMPKTPLALVEDLTARLIDPVLQGELDAALIASDPETDALEITPLFDEPFLLVLPQDHPLAAGNIVEASAIDPQQLLLLADGHCLRDQALELCQHTRRGEGDMADMRATSLQTLLHMAAAGYGMTLMPGLALLDEPRLPGNLAARRLRGPHTSRLIRLISRPTNPRRPAIEALSQLIKKSIPEALSKPPE